MQTCFIKARAGSCYCYNNSGCMYVWYFYRIRKVNYVVVTIYDISLDALSPWKSLDEGKFPFL